LICSGTSHLRATCTVCELTTSPKAWEESIDRRCQIAAPERTDHGTLGWGNGEFRMGRRCAEMEDCVAQWENSSESLTNDLPRVRKRLRVRSLALYEWRIDSTASALVGCDVRGRGKRVADLVEKGVGRAAAAVHETTSTHISPQTRCQKSDMVIEAMRGACCIGGFLATRSTTCVDRPWSRSAIVCFSRCLAAATPTRPPTSMPARPVGGRVESHRLAETSGILIGEYVLRMN
jgi:hypothetical protein